MSYARRHSTNVCPGNRVRYKKTSRYKYEVLSRRSKYYGNVDVIYSREDMRAGHHYLVSVNGDTANPRVTRVLREIERDKTPSAKSVPEASE